MNKYMNFWKKSTWKVPGKEGTLILRVSEGKEMNKFKKMHKTRESIDRQQAEMLGYNTLSFKVRYRIRQIVSMIQRMIKKYPKVLFLLIFFSSCISSREFRNENRYLVTIETNKPKKINAFRYSQTTNLDSIVIQNFGYAIKNFKSDSIFLTSPYFRIETLNKAVYGELKK